jgi:hypothetical protein
MQYHLRHTCVVPAWKNEPAAALCGSVLFVRDFGCGGKVRNGTEIMADDIAWVIAVASWLVVVSTLGAMVFKAYKRQKQRRLDNLLLEAYEKEFGRGFYKGH